MDASDLKSALDRSKEWATLILHQPNIRRWPVWQQVLVRMLRALVATVREFRRGQLSLMAMSLVYTTLLSIVPLLAVSFSVLKGFGVHNQVEPFLLNLLAPLGDRGQEIAGQIITFVDNVKVGVLGAVGLALLFYTVVSLMTKIERALNYTWQVSRGRSYADRFTHYISVLILGPVLMFTSLGIMASVTASPMIGSLSAEPVIGDLIAWGSKLIPYLMVVLTFTIVYSLMPNTKVKVSSAFAGAVITGFLWQLTGWAFTSFVVNSPNAAIYAAFFTLVVFMIWLYASWLILLVGGSISFFFQNTQFTIPGYTAFSLSGIAREGLALSIMKAVADSFRQGSQDCTIGSLAERFGVPDSAVSWAVGTLSREGLLVSASGKAAHLVPGRALDTINIGDVIDRVRGADDTEGRAPSLELDDPAVAALWENIEQSRRRALADMTLADLSAASPAPTVSRIGS